jgi:anti-sigma factor RsiW
MKNCKEIENNLPLYLDSLLTGADKQALEEHLKSCPRCTKALIQLSKTQTLVNDLTEVEPPAWFKQKIMAKVREESEKKSLVQKWFYPLRIKIPVQILATVFIAVLAVYIYRAGEEQMKEVVPSSAPVPVMEVQKSQLPEQKMKTSVDENIQKEDQVIEKKGMPREEVREVAVDATKDVNKQVVTNIEADKYESAPAAKSVEQSGAELEKKKESNILGAAMKASRAPRAQRVMPNTKVLLKVADIDTAVGQVEKLLIKYEAKNINRQTTQGKVIMTVELKNQKTNDFTTRLKTIGQVEEGSAPLNNTEGNIFLVIEILNK